MGQSHKYQSAIDFINTHGKRKNPIKASHVSYNILKALADAKGISMNGARMQVASLNKMSPKSGGDSILLIMMNG